MSGYGAVPGGAPAGYGTGVVGPAWLHPVAAAHLRQGEQLRAVFPTEVDDLLPPRLPRRYRIRTPRQGRIRLWPVVRFVLEWIVPESWVWVIQGNTSGNPVERGASRGYRAIRRRFHGGSWSGGYRSAAGALLIAVRNSPDAFFRGQHSECVLAVTTHRLLVLSEPTSAVHERPYPAHLLAEYPRGEFGRRRAEHPARQLFRADVEFRDASWIALRLDERAQVAELTSVLG
ncbi:hypothetical protein [Streptomyces sp. NPDC053427]|uniref:hypothetical protein n=1 Tax=Streptomyces sp. NPDC053427 TaxID=3365701 RepID=UPI0037CE5FDF